MPPVAPIAIHYTAPAGCPDEISVRAGVIARLGQDPFRGDAPRSARIDVARTRAGFVAAIELTAPDQPVSRRAIGPAVRCEDAVDALELALAVIIDPTSAGANPAPNPPPNAPPNAPPNPPIVVQPPPLPAGSPQPYPQPARPVYQRPGWRMPLTPPAPPRYEFAVALGSLSGAAQGSMFTLGLRAGYAIDEHWRAGLYARFGRDESDPDTSRHADVTIAELQGEGCRRQGLLFACVVFGVGSKSVTIDRDDPMFIQTRVADYSDPYLVAGASLSFDLPLGAGIVRPSLNALFPVPAVEVESEGTRRASLPPGELGFDLALGYRW